MQDLPADIPRNLKRAGRYTRAYADEVNAYRRQKEEEANDRLLANLDAANRLGSTDPKLGAWALVMERERDDLKERLALLEMAVDLLLDRVGA